MIFKTTIKVLFVLLFFSCNEKNEKQKIELKSERIIESTTEINPEPKIEIDYSKNAEIFAKEILQEDFRIHKFTIRTEKPKYLRIFNSKNLDLITAYSNKNYPEKREPNHYEHFTLFVLKYKNNESAKNSFDNIKSDSKYGWIDLKNLNGEIKTRVRTLSIYAKYGGLILHKDNQIYNLVETCQGVPKGVNNWIEYENKFINSITENNEKIEILNADCGNDRFYPEKRKASR